MEINKILYKRTNGFDISYIENTGTEVKFTFICQDCGSPVHLNVSHHKVGRVYCGNCSNKRVVVLNIANTKLIDVRLITFYEYNKYSTESKEESDERLEYKLYSNKLEAITEYVFNLRKYSYNVPVIVGKKYKKGERPVEIPKAQSFNISNNGNKEFSIINNGKTIVKLEKQIEEYPENEKVEQTNILDLSVVEDMYSWSKVNGELGELVIKLFSKRMNNRKLSDYPIDSTDEIKFNRGSLKGNFVTTPLDITSNLRIRKEFPKAYSYNKLYIYNYLSFMYKVDKDREIEGHRIDMLIEDEYIAIIYAGSPYNDKRDIERIRRALIRNSYHVIIVECMSSSENLKLVDNRIILNNRRKVNIDSRLYRMCNNIADYIYQYSDNRPSMEDVKQRMNLVY